MDVKVYQQVDGVMRRYGVPASVWYPIVVMESGGNPAAVGDNGASIGLFQLNMNGGQGSGYTREFLHDPVNNASIAAASIAAAFQSVREQYPESAWAAQTAIRSGHPGGSVARPLSGSAADSAVNRLMNLSRQFLAGQAVTVGASGASGSAGGGSSGFSGSGSGSSILGADFSNLLARMARVDWFGVFLAVFGFWAALFILGWIVSETDAGKAATKAAAGAVKAAAVA